MAFVGSGHLRWWRVLRGSKITEAVERELGRGKTADSPLAGPDG
jgi:hypothetical protein